MESIALDAAGHRRSPATMPGYHQARPPRNKGMRYPADPAAASGPVCVAGSPPIDPREAIPILTRDPDDDPIVFAALRADVDLLISDDKDVVPDRRFQTYQHEDHRLLAVTFGVLVEDHIDAPWADIDGSWLAVAHERLQVGDVG